MIRFPYEMVIIEAEKILDKMVLATNSRDTSYYRDLYYAWLEATGWDYISFDQEIIKHVDANWEDVVPVKILN